MRRASSFCPVESSVNSYLDYQDRLEAEQEAEEREYWADGELRSLEDTPEGMDLEKVEDAE